MKSCNKGRYICHIHDDIILMCSRIKNVDTYDNKTKLKIDKLVSQIQTYTEDAKECGESMESRLQDYKFAIENLGFKREKGKPKSKSKRRT